MMPATPTSDITPKLAPEAEAAIAAIAPARPPLPPTNAGLTTRWRVQCLYSIGSGHVPKMTRERRLTPSTVFAVQGTLPSTGAAERLFWTRNQRGTSL
jgi:hypothetical protein